MASLFPVNKMLEIIQEIYSEDRSRRLFIRRRTDGRFCYQKWYWLPEPNDEAASCWMPEGCIGIHETPEVALREARVNVPWLAAETRAEAEILKVDAGAV